MTLKRQLKLYSLAFILGGILAIEFFRIPVSVKAEPMAVQSIVPTIAITPTPTVVPPPDHSLDTITNAYHAQGLQREYAEYIWNKWAPHGNRAQAVALCTNISEGHLDDAAYNENTDGSNDKGCWQYNSIHNLPDSLTQNCKEATDYTYAVWVKRLKMGIVDGFKGMWYGYGSNNYQTCMSL